MSNTEETNTVIHGVVGDTNPVEHGGGVIYDCGYGPEVIYFSPWGTDEDFHVTVTRFPIPEPSEGLDWADLTEVAEYASWGFDGISGDPQEPNLFIRAHMYIDTAAYYGMDNLDSYPQEMTLEEAEEHYRKILGESTPSSSLPQAC